MSGPTGLLTMKVCMLVHFRVVQKCYARIFKILIFRAIMAAESLKIDQNGRNFKFRQPLWAEKSKF